MFKITFKIMIDVLNVQYIILVLSRDEAMAGDDGVNRMID